VLYRVLVACLALAALLPIARAVGQSPGGGPTEAARHPPDTMQARTLACAPCHGELGEGTSNDYFPRLAGKPAGYLYNQLHAFHDGRRRYAPMNYLLEFLPDGYLREMAEFFAAQTVPAQPASVPVAARETLLRGQSLALNGAPDRGIPPCVRCHGPALTGMEPGIPGLLGLKPNYISAQLGAWRYGTRTALAPDCMQLVASHLTEADVGAVAAWLSSLPVPAGQKPLPAKSLDMPLPCGSEPN
jgi:cytochrome c553